MRDAYLITPRKNVIVGVGSALVDICLRETVDFVREAGAQIGGMTLVDRTVAPALLEKSANKPAIIPGGSACNTILGIGRLGGTARFVGKRGDDEWGQLFEDGVRKHQVEPRLFVTATPTGNVLSIITPDAQRSMLTFLGASAETSPAEITKEVFTGACLVHLEGYLLFNKELMTAVLRAARAADAAISLDLASYTVVENSLEYLRSIMHEYVDIVIANEDEARAYTGSADENESLRMLSEQADIAVVKLGARGSMIAHEQTVTRIGIHSGGGPVIDSTGAGDLWAAGFLYGLTHGLSMEQSGNLGSACGYEVCQVIGATIPEEGWGRIRNVAPSARGFSSEALKTL
ncbi:MAG: adenosine kinase [Chitinispirillaceae bacterium]|nr:adenosine kinase [Chitinispirillaceae bacterium]